MKKIVVPEGMLQAAHAEAVRNGGQIEKCLEAALQWLVEILHPRNVEFHRAILDAEVKRFPGSNHDGSVIERRVDFEYGVSFARNYITDLFVEPEPVIPEEVKDLLWSIDLYKRDGNFYEAIPNINETILKAFRRGQETRDK